MEWNYNRVGENGRLYSYYGRGQTWNYSERGKQHTIKVVGVYPQQNGVQYYIISKDGELNSKPISAARLHYVLNQKQAKEVTAGAIQPLPLLVEEVEAYYKQLSYDDLPNCMDCGGLGVYGGKICHCAERLAYEIKAYNAEKRLEELAMKCRK